MSTQSHGATAAAPSPAVVAWRAEQLIVTGLPAALARSVASNCGYNLHALLSLVDDGCPAALAVRIIAPIEETGHPC